MRWSTEGGGKLGAQPPEQQRDLVRDDVELGFAPLATAADGRIVVGGGPHAGAAYPDRMIMDARRGRIGSVECLVIAPAAQIEIKRMMPEWVPTMRRREKDAEDIARLQEALRREGSR